MVTVRERVRIFTPELQLRTRTGLGGTRRMLCVTGPQVWLRQHPRPNLAQGSWVQRARPQVTGPARPCDRQRLGQRAQGTVLRRAPCQERNRQNLSRRKRQGGIAPPTKRIIFNFAKEVGSPSAVDRTDYGTGLRQRPGRRPAPLATALARRRLWRRARHQQRCSQHACRALIHDRSQCPAPLRAGPRAF